MSSSFSPQKLAFLVFLRWHIPSRLHKVRLNLITKTSLATCCMYLSWYTVSMKLTVITVPFSANRAEILGKRGGTTSLHDWSWITPWQSIHCCSISLPTDIRKSPCNDNVSFKSHMMPKTDQMRDNERSWGEIYVESSHCYLCSTIKTTAKGVSEACDDISLHGAEPLRQIH